MGTTRPMGIGKSAKLRHSSKKQDSKDASSSSQPIQPPSITVEVDDSLDIDDEYTQLKVLWYNHNNKSILRRQKESDELVLNGIIHECDRLLRNQDEKGTRLPAEFHAIYGLSLAELGEYKGLEAIGDENDAKPVSKTVSKPCTEFYGAAIERLSIGLGKYPSSPEILLAKFKIIVDRILVNQFQVITEKSTVQEIGNLRDLVDIAIESFDKGLKLALKSSSGTTNKPELSYIGDQIKNLESLYNIIDFAVDFGKKMNAEDDEDEMMDIDESEYFFQIDSRHPLYKLRKYEEKYRNWILDKWLDILKFLQAELPNITKGKGKQNDVTQDKIEEVNDSIKLVSKFIGLEYVRQATPLGEIYTEAKYSEEDDGMEIDYESLPKQVLGARSKAIKLLTKAVHYLTQAEDKDISQSLVDSSEAMISLANLYELESRKQIDLYDRAARRLKKANDASDGAYQDALDSLLEG